MVGGLERAVADAFGLGAVVGAWEPVRGGRSHLLWKLRTERGAWAVKRLNRSREPWWMAEYELAAEIELAAHRRGIAMPAPVHPVAPAAPLLADIPTEEGPASFLVRRWCDGVALTEATPEVRRWVGETLAALHGLPVDRESASPDHPHGVEEWRQWLDEAPADVPPRFLDTVRDHLPDVARAKDAVDRALTGSASRLVFSHRDLKPDNVLLTPRTPVLLDWDGAGAEIAEWEVTRTALAFSRTPAGWDPTGFTQVVRAYEAAAGVLVPPLVDATAGILHNKLSGAAWLLWRALGHRPVTPAEREAARGHAVEYLADLRRALSQAQHWVRWIDDAHR